VLGVDERRDAARGLRVGHRVQRDGGLTGGLRSVDLDDPAPRQAADTQRHVQGDGSGRDDRDGLAHLLAEAHDRAFAVILLDLRHRQFERFFAVGSLWCHGDTSPVVVRLTGVPVG
jgi:hypothetical protein